VHDIPLQRTADLHLIYDLQDTKDYQPAADMYWAAKDYLKAVQLLGDHGTSHRSRLLRHANQW